MKSSTKQATPLTPGTKFSSVVFTSAIALISTFLALFVAVLVVGPLLRKFLGVPPGFRDHFVSDASLGQAVLAQTVSLVLAFTSLGMLFRRSSGLSLMSEAACASNPFVLGFAFLIFKIAYEKIPFQYHDLEFYTFKTGIPIALVASVPLCVCFWIAAMVRQRGTKPPARS